MARLLVRLDEIRSQVLELRLGVNRLGRSRENDFQIDHPTISATHCEIELVDGELCLRDCGSTNGTFVGGSPVTEARLRAGQSFCLGDIQFVVETTDVTIAIPKIELPAPAAPPVVLPNGSLLCPRHPEAVVTHQCPCCHEVMCDACVRTLRRRGGKALKLCYHCSYEVQALGGTRKKKKSFLGFLNKTVKLPFARTHKE